MARLSSWSASTTRRRLMSLLFRSLRMAEAQRVDAGAVRQRWPLRSPSGTSDKEERGQLVVIGGATHTPGAVLLAGLAGLRVGAGKLTIATTQPTATALA